MSDKAPSVKLACPFCGFDLAGVLLYHPGGFAGGVAAVISNGAPCCNDVPTNDEVKAWARTVYADAR